jgi:hypothetical protein
MMDKVTIVCSDNGKSKTADVLSKSSKHLKVVLEGTTMCVELHRQDVGQSPLRKGHVEQQGLLER